MFYTLLTVSLAGATVSSASSAADPAVPAIGVLDSEVAVASGTVLPEAGATAEAQARGDRDGASGDGSSVLSTVHFLWRRRRFDLVVEAAFSAGAVLPASSEKAGASDPGARSGVTGAAPCPAPSNNVPSASHVLSAAANAHSAVDRVSSASPVAADNTAVSFHCR